MNYVYKYVNAYGTPIYIGITNNLKRRIREHRHDKLEGTYSDIFYIPVLHKEDAEIIEEYLINFYGTEKHYNVAKTHKGPVSFLGDCDSFPWVKFTGDVDKTAEPFMAFDERTVVIEKTKYVKRLSTDQAVQRIYEEMQQAMMLFDDEIEYEKCMIAELNELLEHDADNCVVRKGLELHQKAFGYLLDFQKVYFSMNCTKKEKERAKDLYAFAKGNIAKYERNLAEMCG